MNGASEATLQELLNVNKSMAAAIQQLASKGGGSGGGGGAGPAPDPKGPGLFSKALSSAASGVGQILTGTLGVAASGVSAIFGTVMQSGRVLLANQMALAEGAIQGTNSLSSLTAGLEALPGVLGLIAKAYNYQVKVMEANLATYQAISGVGANLGNNLSAVRDAAKGMGLSLDEFKKTMTDAGPMLSRIGGTAADGAKALVKFNTDLIKGEVGRGLLGMGYSLQEANGLLTNYAAIVGGLSADQMRDQKRMEQSVSMFATELEVSAQLEGKSRQQKEQEMKKAAENAAVQAKLSTMTQDEKDAYQLALSKAMREGGQGAVDLLNAQVGGFVATSKEAKATMALFPKVADQAKGMGDTINSAGTIAEKKAKLDEQSARMAIGASEDMKKFGAAGRQIAGTMSGPVAGAMQSAMNAQARLNNQGVKSLEDKINLDKKAEATAEAAKKSEAGKVAQAQARAKYAGGLMDRLVEILQPFFKIIPMLLNAFESVMNFGARIVKEILIPGFKELFGGVTVNDIIAPFKNFWEGLTGGLGAGDMPSMKEIKDTIVSFLSPIVTTFGELVRSIDFKEVGSRIRQFFITVKNFIGDVWNSLTIGGGIDKAKENIKTWFNVVTGFAKSIMDAIMIVDWKGIAESLGRTLGTVFNAIQEIFQPVFDKAGTVFKQIGDELGPMFMDLSDIASTLFGYLEDIVKVFANILVPLLKPIVSGIMDAVVPFWHAVGSFIKIIKSILTGDFKSIPEQFGKLWDDMMTGFKELLKGLWEGVKTLFSPSKWFEGTGDKKPAEAKPAQQQQAQQPATPVQTAQANTQGAIDKVANDWAWSVYSGRNTLAQVPKDAAAKVSDILKNPPATWKAALEKEKAGGAQQQSAQAKPAEKPAEKPAATPVADLNNKDALQVLKTIADYQRRTIDALNGLQGNLLKRA
jgi:hypothetical protein